MSILHNRTASATNVYFDSERLHVRLSDGREISAPLNWFPRLRNASDEQRQGWGFTGKRLMKISLWLVCLDYHTIRAVK
jgi:hypothetical protein